MLAGEGKSTKNPFTIDKIGCCLSIRMLVPSLTKCMLIPGIEPGSSVWKTTIIPLYYISLSPWEELNLQPTMPKIVALPIELHGP